MFEIPEQYVWVPIRHPSNEAFAALILPCNLPSAALQMFEIPEQYKVRVPLRHPTNEAFAALKLEWYAVPAVSNIELSVGGILYTAAPFNGW
jgi:nitric-oxide synthase